LKHLKQLIKKITKINPSFSPKEIDRDLEAAIHDAV